MNLFFVFGSCHGVAGVAENQLTLPSPAIMRLTLITLQVSGIGQHPAEHSGVECIKWCCDSRRKFFLLVGDIPTVHPIEGHELVVRLGDSRFPVLVARGAGAGQHRLNAEHPRAMRGERKPLQHNAFGALDVNRHEVDHADFALGQHLVKGRCRDRGCEHFEASGAGRLGLTGIKGAQPGARYAVES